MARGNQTPWVQHKNCVHVFFWESFVSSVTYSSPLERNLNKAREKEKVTHFSMKKMKILYEMWKKTH